MKHTIYKLKFCLLLSLFFFQQAYAQERTVSGKVTSFDDGSSLPGVNIMIKGTSSGASSDIDGNFKLVVPEGAVLVFSYIGYTTEEIEVGARSVLDVALMPDLQTLSEVVVVGYGTQKKEDVTGVVTSVDSKNFNGGAIVSPDQLITGKVAGVQITSNSGEPGGGATIRVRGGTSINASNEPLYVIDGLPIDNAGFAGGRNPLNFLNPNDIETFTVLKDASAAAIYGARAANGVIIITTKKGRKDGTSTINYDGYYSVGQIAKELQILNAQEFRDVIVAKAPSRIELLDPNVSTDWQNEILQTAVGQSHNLSYSTGNEKSSIRTSLGYLNQDGIIKKSNTERTSFAVAFSQKLLNDKLNIDANLKTARTSDIYNGTGIGGALSMAPTQPILDANSPWAGYWEWNNDLGTKNPIAELELTQSQGSSFRGMGNIQFGYDLDVLTDGLSAKLNLGMDALSSERKFFQPNNLRGQYANEGEIQLENTIRTTPLLESFLNYNKSLPSFKSQIDAVVGYSWQAFNAEVNRADARELSTNIYGFNNPAVANEYTVSRNIQESRLISFFGRVNYSYDDKYLLTASLRRDGSSRFGESNRWGLFPSVAVGWNLYKESFMDFSKAALSDLKLRVSYGINGNQEIGNYGYLTTYTNGDLFTQYQLGGEFIQTIRPSGVDTNLKWEETASLNAGLDFGLLNGRISGAFEYYNKRTSDLLFVVNVPAGTNLSNRILTNIGEVENSGFELTLNGTVLESEDFSWNLGLNAATNKNTILALDGSDDPDFKGYEVGGISGGTGNNIQILKVGESINTFRVYQHKLDGNGKPLVDLVDHNEDGTINLADMYADVNEDGIVNDEDRLPSKNANPKYLLGLSSNMSYKGFDLSFTMRANLGGYVYNNVASNGGYYNRVSAEIVPQNLVASVLETNFQTPQFFSDYYLEKADFIRMDNITLGYTIRPLADKVNIRVYGTAQNLFVLSSYSGLDPEIQNGIDNNLYPRSRVFLAGISIGL